MTKKQYRIINKGKGPLVINPLNLNEVGEGNIPGVGTDISSIAFIDRVEVYSSTGTGTALLPATNLLAGLFLPTEKVTLEALAQIDLDHLAYDNVDNNFTVNQTAPIWIGDLQGTADDSVLFGGELPEYYMTDAEFVLLEARVTQNESDIVVLQDGITSLDIRVNNVEVIANSNNTNIDILYDQQESQDLLITQNIQGLIDTNIQIGRAHV